ncbi:MAG TPA: hypothetical protein VFE47_11960 [Tepidisphaeraceae bacterium]|jgi:hypothetical protein|nr:hypothetical protein [Tepidisphaeraceae bacterium]
MLQMSFTGMSGISLHPPAVPNAAPATTIAASATAALQEATETPFQTAEEARAGDPIAIEKMLEEQRHAMGELWKGKAIDQLA